MPSHNGMDIDQYMYDSVSITPEALSEEFARVALDLAYWNAQYADRLREHRLAEMSQKRTKAMLYIKHRVLLQEADPKGKTTEAQVDAAVLMDEDMVICDTNAITTEVEKEKARGVLDAVRAKREMVVSLGAHIRAEMAGDPILRSQLANTAAVRSGRG
jgi:hypothetical protein